MSKVKHSSPMNWNKFQSLIQRGSWIVKQDRSDKEEYDVYVAIFWARERDHYSCVECGRNDVPVQGHHIIPQRVDRSKASEVDNIISLCPECHRKVHGR